MPDFLKIISSPASLKTLTRCDLKSLANDIRTRLVDVITQTGGHLASNLGVVELTIALHRCFDSPIDKIFFDVSHQSYVHKLLTGRNDEKFDKIRHSDGYSGFTSPDESVHDNFVAGHAGTALSAALGFAIARDKNNEMHHVIAVIGDAAMSCGETMEALNQVSTCTRRLIIILNDNEFSIDRNVGALAYCFNEILRSTLYDRIKTYTKRCIKVLPFGTKIIKIARRIKNSIKNIILPMSFFENYGLRYVGPINGHDFHQLEESLNFCKTLKEPVILHIKTKKGQGSDAAVNQPEKFHGVSEKICNTKETENSRKYYKDIIGETIVSLARNDKKVIGITAAMSSGTGLDYLKTAFPDQYIDVGIAEEHAVTLAAALAKSGHKPICAIYSTFLQRSFDQILHDVCLQNLHVIFLLRAGLSEHDGATHHGLFDISFLRCIPNAIISQPADGNELQSMILSAQTWPGPVLIRYPNGIGHFDCNIEPKKNLVLGLSESISAGNDICLIALGNMVQTAKNVRKLLLNSNINTEIINARFAKPLDTKMLTFVAKTHKFIVTLEDNVLSGGFGSSVGEFLADNGYKTNILRIGWPDKFISHGSTEEILREENDLSNFKIYEKILTFITNEV